MTVVSAVIPSYNSVRYLAQAIGSVRAQRRPVDEIIIVDDCSSDGSRELAASLGVLCLSTERNSGPARARNLGVRAARGDVIAFLDADDWWGPGHTEAVVGLLERFPEAAVAFSRVRRTGDWTGESAAFIPERQPMDVFWLSLRHSIVLQSAVAVRRDIFLATGGYEESMRYAEDYDLWLRLARHHLFVCTHEVTASYRGRRGQLTDQKARLLRGAYQARRRLFESIARDDPCEAERVAVEIRLLWQRLLAEAWRSRDRDHLNAVLEIGDIIPGGRQIQRHWRRRTSWFWPAWLLVTRAWDRLPPNARRVLKARLHRVRGISAVLPASARDTPDSGRR